MQDGKDMCPKIQKNYPQDNRIANEVQERKPKIIEHWLKNARAHIPAAKDHSDTAVVDHFTTILTLLSECLRTKFEHSSNPNNAVMSRKHGKQRSRLEGYTLDEVITEYILLRQVIFDELEECGLSHSSVNVINDFVDEGIRLAVTEFVAMKVIESQSFTAQINALHADVSREAELQRQTIAKLHEERILRERFVAALTHDLRTPLTAAKMAAQLLTQKLQDPTALLTNAARIIDNMERADEMIRDILDASRVSAGERLTLSLAECDLHQTVKSVLDELSTIHGARFALLSDADVHGYWDCEALQRVVENLATNAVKYGSQDTPIRVTISQHHDLIELTVHNEGKPIPPEDLSKLFQPHHRTHDAQITNPRGWGIGLTIVKGITEQHGGRVEVESTHEKGTIFRVFVPRSRPKAVGVPDA
jgi:signal transduction histidine kinase